MSEFSKTVNHDGIELPVYAPDAASKVNKARTERVVPGRNKHEADDFGYIIDEYHGTDVPARRNNLPRKIAASALVGGLLAAGTYTTAHVAFEGGSYYLQTRLIPGEAELQPEDYKDDIATTIRKIIGQDNKQEGDGDD